MIFTVIPAAGSSARMGRPKLALPLGGRTVLERVIAALRGAGVERVLVVIGPHVAELVPLAQAAGAEALLLAKPTPDMRATVQAGLDHLETTYQPQPDDAWLLVPADHPTLTANIVQRLVQARHASAAHSIVIPTHQGRRGHPALIDWKHVERIRNLPAGTGLNSYLRARAAETLECEIETAEILCDLDTPEDYARLLYGPTHTSGSSSTN